MAGTGPLDVHYLAEDLLQVCVDALDTIPGYDPALAGAPDRAFVSPGEPAFDCCEDGQLTVHASLGTEAPTKVGMTAGIKHRIGGRVNLVGFQVIIIRCVGAYGDGGVPDAAAMQDVAAQTNADMWALWNHVWNAAASGEIFSVCHEVYFDGLRPVATSGNCAGWTLSLRASLDGYEEST